MIPSTMILVGSLMVLGLAGYWMRRALRAERRVAEYDRVLAKSYAREQKLRDELKEAITRCLRIILLETPNMAHVGKKAVAIARGEL